MKEKEACNKLVKIYDKEGEEKAFEFFVKLLRGDIKIDKEDSK